MKHRADIRREDGFTLIEALVTTMVMLAVFFALHSVFEAGVRAAGIGRDEAETVGRARLGMERMERDLAPQPSTARMARTMEATQTTATSSSTTRGLRSRRCREKMRSPSATT